MQYKKGHIICIIKTVSLFIIGAGMLILTGWFLNIPFFKSEVPGIFEMTFNPGVCFLLGVIAFYLVDALNNRHHPKKATYIIFT